MVSNVDMTYAYLDTINISWTQFSYDPRQPHRLRAATDETVKLLMIEASPGFSNARLR